MKSTKFFTTIFVILLFTPLISKADNFQFLYENEYGDVVYASFAQVQIYSNEGDFIYEDETNRYGRINIDLEPGTYILVAYFDDLRIERRVLISGNSGLRQIYF